MVENKRTLEKIILVILSFAFAAMLTMTFKNAAVGQYNTVLAEIFDDLRLSFSGKSLIATILLIVFYRIGIKRYDKELPYRKGFLVFSFLLACIWLMAESFRIDNSLSHIKESSGQIVKSVIYLTGAMFFIYEGIALFNYLIEHKTFLLKKSGSRIIQFADRNIMAVVSVALLLFWSVSVITAYPANMCSDAWVQISQFWGLSAFTTHHPPMYALLTGFFTWIGYSFGNANVGLFLFILFQSVVYAAIIGYSFVLLKKIKAPGWLMGIYFVIAAITPHYVNGVSLVLKDNLYSICLVLFTVESIYALTDTDEFLAKPYHYVLSFISIISVIWFRNNGKYILYPLFAVVIIILFVKRKAFKKQTLIRMTALILGSVIIATAVNSSVIRIYNIQPGSRAEMFSLPFQQTARTVAEHGDEITAAERESINAVLKYDELAENYNPLMSDPIKSRTQPGVGAKAVLNYLLTWVKMFFKYPVSYISATVNQNYILVYPFQENATVYLKFNGVYEDIMNDLRAKIGLEEVTTFESPKEDILYWDYLLFSSPVTGLLSHCVIYVIVLLVTLILAVSKRKYKYLIAALPALLSVGIVILSPFIINSPRYAFPVVYSVPVLLAYYIRLVKDDRIKLK